MREHLFRGRNGLGNWFYGGYIYCKYSETHNIVNENTARSFDWFDVIPETIGQFTGLTDKNGAKIFEHDKIYIDGMYLGYILLTDGAFNLIEENNQSGSNIINQARMNRMEIISNIHEGDK